MASLTRLALAFAFLTRLPVPPVEPREGDFAAAIRCYPIVGLVIGAIVASVAWLGAQVDPWVGALAALVAWVAVTGALHLDGLADVADGVGAAHRSPEQMLAVMADPHVGSFGVVVLVLVLLAKLVLLHLAIGDPLALMLVPFAARIAPLAWARWLPPLRAGGLGAAVAGAVRVRDLVGWGAVLLAASVVAPALLAAPLLVLAFGAWAKRRIGGVTGDVHGAGVELVETGLLFVLAIVRAG